LFQPEEMTARSNGLLSPSLMPTRACPFDLTCGGRHRISETYAETLRPVLPRLM